MPKTMPKTVLKKYLLQNGLKSTKQREKILDTFISLNAHISSEELLLVLQKTMPNIGLATIYRTMKLFVKADIAQERCFADGITRYEYVGDGEHHDHLLCVSCGTIFEFEDDIIEERQTQIAKSYGLKISSHKLDIYGVCENQDDCEHYKKTQAV